MGIFDNTATRYFERRFGILFPKTKDEKKPISTLPGPIEDGSIVIETSGSGAGAVSYAVNFDAMAGASEYEAIKRYQRNSINAEMDRAIREIVAEAVSISDIEPSVKISFKSDTEFGKSIQKKIEESFEEVYRLLDFDLTGPELFRKWYIDSKLMFFKAIDSDKPKEGIKELTPLDPVTCRKVVVIERNLDNDSGVFVTKNVDEFFIYNENSASPFPSTGQKISSDAVCFVPSGLYDYANKRTIGYLHKAIRHLNQLRMIEDSIIVYRLARAPERRIFYIDVGNLPKQRAEQYMREIMNRYRNKQVYDSQSGAMRDGYNHISMLEDFWMPRREGGKSTEISTLAGGQNLGELADLEYFKKKLWESLDVPISRMQSDNKYTFGRASEINRDEVNFSKHIDLLRRRFSELFYDLLKTQLLLKNVINKDEWDKLRQDISFVYLKDAYFSELKEQEVIKSRLETLQQVDQYMGKYFSREYIRRNILRQTDDDMRTMDKQMEQDKKEGFGPPDEMGGDPSMGGMTPNDPTMDQQGLEGLPAESPEGAELAQGPDDSQIEDTEEPTEEAI